MYCAKCGQQLPDDAVFCIKCGTKVTVSLNNQELDNNSIEDTTNTQQNSTQPSIPEENNINHDQQLTTSSIINKNIIYGVILLLLVAGYFIFNGDSNSDNNTRWRAYNGVEYAAKSSAGVDFSLIGVEEKELLISRSGNIVRPNGKFVIVRVYIFNDSNKPISVGVIEDPFQIWDKAQRKYNVVSISAINASLASGEKSLMFYEEINPGMGIKLEIPFDVPKNLDIHSSRFHAKFSYNGKVGSYEEGSISLPLKVITKNKDLNTNNQENYKDVPVNQPAVAKNLTNSNILQNENFTHTVGQTITIKGTGVNMRESYSRSSNVIGVFENGEKVEYLGEHFVRQDGIWMNVKRKNGMTGWVFGNYVKEMFADSNGQSTNNTTQAKDIFIDHWNYENVDIYVVDKSITSGTSGTDKFFKVTVKQVQNGKLIKSNVWSFSQFRGEWRYKTDEMKGNTSTVFNNKIFEYCMKQLGWPFEIVNGGYYN